MNLMPLKLYTETPLHVPLKVTVFRQVQELKSLCAQLTNISRMPLTLRNGWLSEYSDALQESIEHFSQFVSQEIDRSEFDEQLISLLDEYADLLEEATATVELLGYKKAQLKD